MENLRPALHFNRNINNQLTLYLSYIFLQSLTLEYFHADRIVRSIIMYIYLLCTLD